MASHRRPKQASRTRVTVITATAAAAVALTSQAANAAPKPDKKEVKAKVDALYEQAETATEKFNGAKEKQDRLEKQVSAQQDKVARGQEELNKLRDSLGSMATAQYRSGGIDPAVQLLLSSDPDTYLDKASTLDQLSTKQADALKQIREKQRTLKQERQEAADQLADLAETRKALGEKKKEVQGKLADAQELLNTLTAKEKEELRKEEDQKNSVSSGSHGGGSGSGGSGSGSGGSGSGSTVDLGHDVPESGRAAAALAAAKTRIGLPYVPAATGPNSFDCSGLVQWAYKQAGVSLDRTSQAQANDGQRLTKSQLKPGDLVLFRSDLGHIGLYAGNGMVLHAPYPGTNVRYEPMSNMPFQFGVRVG
ncbi:NlpC/P60 family protein [Streptomyces varsoviensis]|uniref:C40 family peptidase n=1 Tax=Streptomyces varsoviensis TaxID=67373 RepID=UPI0033F52B26